MTSLRFESEPPTKEDVKLHESLYADYLISKYSKAEPNSSQSSTNFNLSGTLPYPTSYSPSSTYSSASSKLSRSLNTNQSRYSTLPASSQYISKYATNYTNYNSKYENSLSQTLPANSYVQDRSSPTRSTEFSASSSRSKSPIRNPISPHSDTNTIINNEYQSPIRSYSRRTGFVSPSALRADPKTTPTPQPSYPTYSSSPSSSYRRVSPSASAYAANQASSTVRHIITE
jgi:hypothetical protein